MIVQEPVFVWICWYSYVPIQKPVSKFMWFYWFECSQKHSMTNENTRKTILCEDLYKDISEKFSEKSKIVGERWKECFWSKFLKKTFFGNSWGLLIQVCFSYRKICRPRSLCLGLGLDNLLYEKQIRLINSKDFTVMDGSHTTTSRLMLVIIVSFLKGWCFCHYWCLQLAIVEFIKFCYWTVCSSSSVRF